jgi:DNA recombination protein RmuC
VQRFNPQEGVVELFIVIAGVVVGAVLGLAVGLLAGRRGADATVAAARSEIAGLHAQLAAQKDASGDSLKAAVLEASRQVSEDLARRNADDAEARLEAQRLTLQSVVAPVGTKLGELEQAVKRAEESRTKIDTTVLTRLGDVTTAAGELRDRTGKLTSALEGGSTRGKWGEFQLQRIIEVAGLTPYVTWRTQEQETGGKGSIRPDLLISIPEGRVLVIDAKAPAVAFDGDEPTGDTDANYAKRLRDHIKALAKKDYIEGIPNAVGYVFLFLPSEAAYAGALRADPEVLVFAAENRVAVVAPSTLLSALTVVESIWRQFDANEHLEDAVIQARELHKRLVVFAAHLTKVGDRLGKSMEAFNDAVGSLQRQVYPAARRMEAADLAPGNAVLTVAPRTEEIRPLAAPAVAFDAIGDDDDDTNNEAPENV